MSIRPDLAFRSLTEGDRELLVTATRENLNWSGPRFGSDDVRDRTEFRRYTEFDSTRGDFGVAATRGLGCLGVGWALFLPAERPGFGFVDEHTPEFCLWVDREHRSRGLGRDLTMRVLGEARTRGLTSVSLSVESGNVRAAGLYRSVGFEEIPERRADGVMVWTAVPE